MTSGWRAGLASVGGLLLLLLAFWLGRATAPRPGEPAPPAPSAPAPAEPGRDALAVLRAELEAQRERSEELSAQLAWLQGQMARVGEAVAPEPVRGDAAQGAPGEAAREEGQETPAPWFDAQALLDNDVPEGEVARLRDLFNRYEMERIELHNQAEREGWLDKPRFWNEMLRFQLGMRDEIGDEDYDLMLYATGRKNRVVMSELLDGSPAEGYGFQAGDVVLSYDGQRVFHGRELRRATALGERGDWITVDVLRDGQVVRIRAQRGPLGVKLRPARIAPAPLW